MLMLRFVGEIMTVKIRVNEVSKAYQKNVLENLSFDVYESEFLSILGESGCGKTTLFRCLIGIEEFDKGEVFLDNINITNKPASERKMGIVFQNLALFPNMNVYNNIAYPLKVKKYPKDVIANLVKEMLEVTGLIEHQLKYPHELSGGQKQRVAIARTLVLRPEIILFDEPMSALDVSTKNVLRDFLKEIQAKFGITMIYITHDQEEAFALSDRIMIMNEGKIEQIDTPKNIYNHPQTNFVKKFVVDELNQKVKSILECIKND